jgi:hypothetical protein
MTGQSTVESDRGSPPQRSASDRPGPQSRDRDRVTDEPPSRPERRMLSDCPWPW